MSALLLRLCDVKKSYKKNNGELTHAVKGVTFEIHQGEIFALLGANGAGKTTLSSIIMTLHSATSGSIEYQGVSIYNQLMTYRRILGICPQKPNMHKHLTTDEILTLAGKIFGMTNHEIEQRKQELIKMFDLTAYVNSKQEALSGGYRQRVLIARALMHRPKLLILDEPTVALDPHIRRQLWDSIKQLKHEGTTVILTTHYLEEADYLADRVCILHKGLIKLIDTPANLKVVYQKGSLEDVFVHLMHEATTDTTNQ